MYLHTNKFQLIMWKQAEIRYFIDKLVEFRITGNTIVVIFKMRTCENSTSSINWDK